MKTAACMSPEDSESRREASTRSPQLSPASCCVEYQRELGHLSHYLLCGHWARYTACEP